MRLPLTVLLTLLACAPAEAATTVATAGDFELRARQKDGRMCIVLKRAGRWQGQRCGRIPRSPHRPLGVFPDVGYYNYAAAVAPSVRIAETENRRGRRERHPTVAARGFSARFVILPAPPRAVFVRFYGADGTLLGVDAGPAGYIIDGDRTQVFGAPGDGVVAYTQPWLAPTPDEADRLTTLACIEVTNGLSAGVSCDGEGESLPLVVVGECDGSDLAGGIVDGGVASVRFTLGSGAEVTLPAGELPAAFGGRRVLGAQLPSREAVREAAALDAAGEVVARAVVGTPPSGQPCAGEDQTHDGFNGSLAPASPPSGAVTVASAGGESLLAADRGETLCAGLGELSARNCPPPPVDSDRPRLLWRDGTVGGVLSRDAERVTLQLDRGDDVTVPTTDGAAYVGRWAGDVRFFAAAVGAGREVTGAVVRAADGTIIGISGRRVPRPQVRTVLAKRGGRGVQLVRREGAPPCMTAFAADLAPAPRFCTDLDPGIPIDGPYLPYSGAVVVPCAPRRALAYGRLPDRLAAPRIELAGGRTVRSRIVSLRGEDAWLAFLPDVAVRGLRSGDHRAPLRLPPASEQCGYSVVRSF